MVNDPFEAYIKATNILENDACPVYDIWHYTSWAGLSGILHSKSVWLSHATHLEDTSEIQYSLSQIKNYVLQNTADKLHVFFQDLFQDFENEFFNTADFYVASFCLAEDYLTAWRNYGDDGKGYSIKFNKSFFMAGRIIPDTCNLLFSRGKVYYNIADISQLLSKLIQIVYNQIIINNAFGKSIKAIESRKSIAKRFLSAIMPLLALIKKNVHSVESEHRIYALAHKNNSNQKISPKILTSKHELTEQKLYFKFSLEHISEIMLGPQLKNEISRLRVHSLLKDLSKLGYNTDHISVSISKQSYKDKVCS